jgi:hypothetical protein
MVAFTKVSAYLPGLTSAYPIVIGSTPHALVEETSENPMTLAE